MPFAGKISKAILAAVNYGKFWIFKGGPPDYYRNSAMAKQTAQQCDRATRQPT
jgi:hypothetical protein